MDKVIKKIKKDPLAIKRINLEIHWEEVPQEVSLCENLEKLDLAYTEIEVIPDFIFQLPKLKALDFTGCEALQFPTQLLDSPHIKALGVWCNDITELGHVFALHHLEKLTISGDFNTIPEAIGQLKNLKSLTLFGVPITQIPESLNQLPQLAKLDLNTGFARLDIEQAIAVLKGCCKLSELKLETEDLKIPESIAQLAGLKVLDLSNNGLRSIPEAVFELKQLKTLDLGLNELKKLPKGIGNLKKLSTLKLNSNWQKKLDTTNLMEEIHLLENLQVLQLWSCQSVKHVPETIVQCKKLKELDLDNNKLTDLPESIYEMTWLKTLRVTTNPLKAGIREKLLEKLPNTKVMVH